MQLKNKKRILITIGVLCFVLGIYLLSYNYIQGKVLKAYDKMNLEILALNANIEHKENNTNQNNQKQKTGSTAFVFLGTISYIFHI